MADTDSGIEFIPEDLIHDRPEILTFQQYVLICRNCRSVLYPWQMNIRSNMQFVWFPVDLTTVVFNSQLSSWFCRRCHVKLSSGTLQNDIINSRQQNQCILSMNDVTRIFATYHIAHY